MITQLQGAMVGGGYLYYPIISLADQAPFILFVKFYLHGNIINDCEIDVFHVNH